jgi:hypothetical protein
VAQVRALVTLRLCSGQALGHLLREQRELQFDSLGTTDDPNGDCPHEQRNY